MSTGVGQCLACGGTYDDETPCDCQRAPLGAASAEHRQWMAALRALDQEIDEAEMHAARLAQLRQRRALLVRSIERLAASRGA